MVPGQPESVASAQGPTPARKRRWRRLGVVLLLLAVVLLAIRLALPSGVRWYVNRTLDQNPLYDGMIGDVSLHLWRGAYSIEDVRIVKTTGNVAVPFFAAGRVDLAIEWPALLEGSLVGRVVLERPELNFVDGNDESQDQTGEGGAWLEIMQRLFPFKINSADLRDGRVHFRAFQTDPPVDVYLSSVAGSIQNLTNVHDEVTPMMATVEATALAMDHARVEFGMKLDPFSYRPTFELALRLIGLDVTKTNELARAYGSFDFEQGWFDLVIELEASEGGLDGYVKPLFRNLEVLDLSKDVQEDNVLVVFWETVVGATAAVFKNPSRDQVATVIPVSGDLRDPHSDFLATLGNILRNAFVRAYLPRLHRTTSEAYGLTFGTGSVVDSGAPSDK